MSTLDSPFVVLVVALVAQWLAAYGGDFLRKRTRSVAEDIPKPPGGTAYRLRPGD